MARKARAAAEPAETLEAPADGADVAKTARWAAVLARARENYRRNYDESRDWLDKAALDEQFIVPGQMWDANDRAERAALGLPSLEEDRVLQNILLFVNDAKANRPGLMASPLDAKSMDRAKADVVEGFFRSVENESTADVAYDQALMDAAVPGAGYWYVQPKRESPASFDQTLEIVPVFDFRMAQLDCASKDPVGADARHGFIMRDLLWPTFTELYPDSEATRQRDIAPQSWESLSHDLPGWASKDGCRIAYYFEREQVKATLSRIATPHFEEQHPDPQMAAGEQARRTAFEAWLGAAKGRSEEIVETDPAGNPLREPSYADVLHTEALPAGIEAQRTMPSPYYRVMQYTLTAHEVLREDVYSDNAEADPEGWIPIVRVAGLRCKMRVTLKTDWVGLARPQRDSNLMLNFSLSALGQALGMAPKPTFVSYEGATDNDDRWSSIHTTHHPMVTAKAVPKGWDPKWGPCPLPTLLSVEPPIGAITSALQIFGYGMEMTSGQGSAARGMEGDAKSGVAIRERKEQSAMVSYHILNNFHNAIRHTGRLIFAQMAQRIDTARTLRLLNEDGTSKMAQVNQQTTWGNKSTVINMLSGRHDVVMSSEANYATKLKQAAAQMPELARWVPIFGEIMPDKIARASGLPGFAEGADRLKRYVKTKYPSVLGPEDQDDSTGPDARDTQIQQLQQQVQQAEAAAKDKSGELEIKRGNLELDRQKAIMDTRIKILTLREQALEHEADLRHEENLHAFEAHLAALEGMGLGQPMAAAAGGPAPTGGRAPAAAGDAP